ncbi:hypothetical protein MHYP_G00217230 [Metynnis hypsauchen]
MPKEKVQAHLPEEFGNFQDTQVILDCTELRCQTPSSLLLQSEVFSNYKSHCTFKALTGMAPHGAITFVSGLYAGSINDRQMFRQSGIIPLLTPDMAIMVDKGFLVDDLVPCKIHRPVFLKRCSAGHLHKLVDVIYSQTSGSKKRTEEDKVLPVAPERDLAIFPLQLRQRFITDDVSPSY